MIARDSRKPVTMPRAGDAGTTALVGHDPDLNVVWETGDQLGKARGRNHDFTLALDLRRQRERKHVVERIGSDGERVARGLQVHHVSAGNFSALMLLESEAADASAAASLPASAVIFIAAPRS